MHQPILIAHDICNAFHANSSLEVTGVFLDISKAFDSVLRRSLLHELKCLCINGNFFSNKYQSAVFNDQATSSADAKAGVPQGSIHCP